MTPDSIHELIRSASGARPRAALEDPTALFWVEWREDDDQIPTLCEAVLKSKELSSDWDDDDQLFVVWRGRRTRVPLLRSTLASVAASPLVGFLDSFLPVSPADLLAWPSRGNRHKTLLALNQALGPEYEVRYLAGSLAEGAAAFAPLSAADWIGLEQQYGREALEAVFLPVREQPNLFEAGASPVDELAPPWWSLW